MVLLSCLQLLVALLPHCFHLCGSLLHVVVIIFIFAISSMLKASIKFHYFCLLLHNFVICFSFFFFFHFLLSKASKEELLVSLQFFCFLVYLLIVFHHHFLKLLEKSLFFPCSFNVFLHVSFLLSIIIFQSFKRRVRSLLKSSSF